MNNWSESIYLGSHFLMLVDKSTISVVLHLKHLFQNYSVSNYLIGQYLSTTTRQEET